MFPAKGDQGPLFIVTVLKALGVSQITLFLSYFRSDLFVKYCESTAFHVKIKLTDFQLNDLFVIS